MLTIAERKPISYQPVFAKVARTHPELCRQMVERVLGRKVDELALASPEYDANAITHRGVRFDVLLAGESEYVEVEMQASGEPNLPKRLRYYHAHIDQLLLEKGEPIGALRPVYVIFFCLHDPFRLGLPLYTFRVRCMEDASLAYDDGSTSIAVALDNFEREEDPKLAALMRYLLTNVPDDADRLTVELAQAVDGAYRDESWVGTMLTLEQRIAEKEYYAREQGIAEGKAEGIAEENRRYSELMKKLNDSGMNDAETLSLMRENSLEELFAKFDIK